MRCAYCGLENEPSQSWYYQAIEYFKAEFSKRLQEHFSNAQFGGLREVQPNMDLPDIPFFQEPSSRESRVGSQLDLETRLSEYSQRGSDDQVRLFARYVAYAVDVENFPVLQIIGLRFAPALANVSRTLTHYVLKNL